MFIHEYVYFTCFYLRKRALLGKCYNFGMIDGSLKESETMINDQGVDLITAHFKEKDTHGSEFSLPKLIRVFQQAVSMFPLAEVEKKRRKLLEIAINGSLNGERINPSQPGGGPARNYIDQRTKLIGIYSKNTELAEAIVHYNIVGVHGATSGTIPGVLENGLVPLSELDEKAKLIVSGEQIFASEAMQKTTSFVHWDRIDDIKMYFGEGSSITSDLLIDQITKLEKGLSEMMERDHHKEDGNFTQNFRKLIERNKKMLTFLQTPAKNEEESLLQDLVMQNFPVVYGINLQGINKESVTKPFSHIQTEFVVEDGVPVKNIKIIFVPESKIEFVRQMIKDKDQAIEVYSLESIREQ